jgi:hypothetical protein
MAARAADARDGGRTGWHSLGAAERCAVIAGRSAVFIKGQRPVHGGN